MTASPLHSSELSWKHGYVIKFERSCHAAFSQLVNLAEMLLG